jgi:hypothetical protein
MSVGAAIGLGAVLGLALGIVVSVTTDIPLAPEVGLVLGALVGWLSRRDRGQDADPPTPLVASRRRHSVEKPLRCRPQHVVTEKRESPACGMCTVRPYTLP